MPKYGTVSQVLLQLVVVIYPTGEDLNHTHKGRPKQLKRYLFNKSQVSLSRCASKEDKTRTKERPIRVRL